MNIPELLLVVREDKNYTQEEMGDEIGIDNRKISKWEMGEFNPTLSEMRSLAAYFDLSINEIADEKNTKDKNGEFLFFLQEEFDISSISVEFFIFVELFLFYLAFQFYYYSKKVNVLLALTFLICMFCYIFTYLFMFDYFFYLELE